MAKITEAELATVRILAQNAQEAASAMQTARGAYQDYFSKLKVAYSLSDTDVLDFRSGEITQATKPEAKEPPKAEVG